MSLLGAVAGTAAPSAAAGPAISAAGAGDPTGTWMSTVQTPDGRRLESTLTLTWTDGRLGGTIDNRAGKAEISAAGLAADEITFTVVRNWGRGLRRRAVATHYSGRLAGDGIAGTIETTGRDGQAVALPWQAQRVR